MNNVYIEVKEVVAYLEAIQSQLESIRKSGVDELEKGEVVGEEAIEISTHVMYAVGGLQVVDHIIRHMNAEAAATLNKDLSVGEAIQEAMKVPGRKKASSRKKAKKK